MAEPWWAGIWSCLTPAASMLRHANPMLLLCLCHLPPQLTEDNGLAELLYDDLTGAAQA